VWLSCWQKKWAAEMVVESVWRHSSDVIGRDGCLFYNGKSMSSPLIFRLTPPIFNIFSFGKKLWKANRMGYLMVFMEWRWTKKRRKKRNSRTSYDLLYIPDWRQLFNSKNTVYRKFNKKILKSIQLAFQNTFRIEKIL